MFAKKQRLAVDSTLIPMVEVPADEAWLHKDKKSLASVKRGLLRGKSKKRGSFARYASDEI